MNYGIQLYSVRDMAKDDYEKALREVAALGYEFVEPAGFFGHSAEQVKEWLDKYGLTISGTHSGFADLDEDFEATVKYHKTIGNTKYIVPGVDTSTREALDAAVEKFNKYAPMLADHGIEMGYHNHHREFIQSECHRSRTVLPREDQHQVPDRYLLGICGPPGSCGSDGRVPGPSDRLHPSEGRPALSCS